MKKNLEMIFPVVFLATLVMAVLAQANPLLNKIGQDSGTFTYIGSRLLSGARLYVDAWDHKGPGIFYADALALWLGHGSRWGIWFLEFIFLFAAAILTYHLLLKEWGHFAAVVGSLSWLGALNIALSGGNLSEEYPLLFNMIALWAFLSLAQGNHPRSKAVLIGAMGACSALFRVNNIGLPIAIGLAILLVGLFQRDFKNTFTKIFWVTLGGLFVVGLVLAWFISQNAFKEFLLANILYSLSYSEDRVYSASPSIWGTTITGFKLFGAFAWIVFAGYLFNLYDAARQLLKKNVSHLTFVIVFLLPVEILLSSISGRNVSHYFISWASAMALTSAVLIGVLQKQVPAVRDILVGKWAKFQYVLYPAVILVVMLIFRAQLLGYLRVVNEFARGGSLEVSEPVVDYIRQHSSPQDQVLVWTGHAKIYFMLGRPAPTRYMTYPWFVDSPYTYEIGQTYYQDILSHPPALLIDSYSHNPDQMLSLDRTVRKAQYKKNKKYYQPDFTDEVLDFFDAHYHLEAEVDGYSIYRINTNP